MRPDLRQLLERARELGTSTTARRLLDLVDELLDLDGLVGEMMEAQATFFTLSRSTRATDAERARALERAKDLEARVRAERRRLGLAAQQGLPGVE